MNKNDQAKLTDDIVCAGLFLEKRNLKVGEAYQYIARRNGPEFREMVKQLPSEAFSTSRMAVNHVPDPSPIEQALAHRKNERTRS